MKTIQARQIQKGDILSDLGNVHEKCKALEAPVRRNETTLSVECESIFGEGFYRWWMGPEYEVVKHN